MHWLFVIFLPSPGWISFSILYCPCLSLAAPWVVAATSFSTSCADPPSTPAPRALTMMAVSCHPLVSIWRTPTNAPHTAGVHSNNWNVLPRLWSKSIICCIVHISRPFFLQPGLQSYCSRTRQYDCIQWARCVSVPPTWGHRTPLAA